MDLKLLGIASLGLCLLAAPAAFAQEAVPNPQSEGRQDWNREMRLAQREAVLDLLDSDRPRDLLLAALLYPLALPGGTADDGSASRQMVDPDLEPVRLLARAAELAPDDPLIAWAQAHCPEPHRQAGCDSHAARERLLGLDPDNGYVRLLWLEDVSADREGLLLAGALLSEAAKARRFDTYLNSVGRLFLDFFAGIEWPATPQPAMTAEALAVGYVMAIAMPAYGQLNRLCLQTGETTLDSAMRTDCIAVFERMFEREAATVLDVGLACSALIRLHENESERDRWRERLRRLRWLQEQTLPIMTARDFMAGPGPAYVRRWFEHGEVSAMRELLRENGIAIEPPPDWQPASAPGA